MATGADLRRMALALPGTSEAPHFDRAAFRARRIFVTLAADERSANIRLTPDEQEFKCMLLPDALSPLDNAWGRKGWTLARLEALTLGDLEALLAMAYAHGTASK